MNKLLHDANSCLLESGLFNEEDIKSRLYSCQQSMVGLGKSDVQFMHMRLEIMQGRSAPTKQQLMANLTELLRVY
jgi:5-carboxymethyl-2-hydroxymuconate isomerase